MDDRAPLRRIESGADGWLSSVRNAIVDVLVVTGSTDPDAVPMYLTAVSEIATNAVEAHERAGSLDPVVVSIDPLLAQVMVADLGGGFDPGAFLSLPEPSQVHGRGLFLARQFCPGLSWQRTAGGMECTLPFP